MNECLETSTIHQVDNKIFTLTKLPTNVIFVTS